MYPRTLAEVEEMTDPANFSVFYAASQSIMLAGDASHEIIANAFQKNDGSG